MSPTILSCSRNVRSLESSNVHLPVGTHDIHDEKMAPTIMFFLAPLMQNCPFCEYRNVNIVYKVRYLDMKTSGCSLLKNYAVCHPFW